jgi:hypothetical protein
MLQRLRVFLKAKTRLQRKSYNKIYNNISKNGNKLIHKYFKHILMHFL